MLRFAGAKIAEKIVSIKYEIHKIRNTMWKFQDFSVTQILREIKFGDSRCAKSAILTHLQALNFDFHDFLHFLKNEIYKINRNEN